MMSSKRAGLLDPAFLKKLERLRIHARRAFPGSTRGERRSTRRGSSVEFSDFRKYEAGDDFRHVDWSIYARLERLMLRQFVEEEDVRIDILIDQSRSMRFGEPITKFDYARRAAAALAFLGIGSLDRVGVATFDSAMKSRIRALRGRGHLRSILSFLDCLSDDDVSKEKQETVEANERAEGESKNEDEQAAETNLSAALRGYQKANLRQGILFIISDFFSSDDYRQEIKMLAHRGFDVNLIQVLAPEEMNPRLVGDLLLVDSETGQSREITASERVVAAYREALNEFTSSLESLCRTHGSGYTLVTTDIAFEELLLKNLIESRMAE
ncbi:MAG TPA: DUF58 domain-containing protein [Blastocatellia bacterium]|nr:DUF58 domain-containing protein [Blastocatellia bacterium]